MPQQGLVYIEFMGIARLFLKKLYFFWYNFFLLFCTGSPLYFCEFLLIYNIAQYNIAHYFLWQVKPSPGCSHVSMGLITAKFLSAPRYPASDGAYYGKILIYAPISRYRRGLLQQNPYLRPDILVSTGLITAKSLYAPRYPGIDGAYYGKILICAPMYKRGGYNRPGLVSHTRVCESRWV